MGYECKLGIKMECGRDGSHKISGEYTTWTRMKYVTKENTDEVRKINAGGDDKLVFFLLALDAIG